jgi:Bacterial SH3 domain
MRDDHCIRWLWRLAASAAACAFLTACTTEMNAPGGYPSAAAGTPVYGLEHGSHLEGAISNDDREAIAGAAGGVLLSDQPGAVRPWSASDGSSGEVKLGGTYLIGLDAVSGAPVAAPDGIDAGVALAPAGGNFVTLKNANVRLGTSSSATVSQTVPAGTPVRAYGYDKAGNWYLVGTSDSVIGYVSGELLKPTTGGDLVLAGGSAKRPQLCREVDLSITTADSKSDSWSSYACKTADGGWQVPSERGLS